MAAEQRGIAVGPGEVTPIGGPLAGGEVTILARGEETGGTLTTLITAVEPGTGPPLHVHRAQEETIYVLDGQFRWKLGDDMVDTPAGGFVFVPRGQRHCFQNTGSDRGRLLITFAPAGMEDFFEQLAQHQTLDPAVFAAVAAENGMDVVGPPLAESDPL
jgi:quercetin dioxygenase-like cupin family protein